jgi:hypothetical protein
MQISALNHWIAELVQSGVMHEALSDGLQVGPR